ncbi:polycystin-1-like protein 2 [Amphiura filiformis]|uniref:polycystin-1-like protein 2 n=1 Tax=Amphiura filiformis TaxID=82378 RepID=UPI003B21A136
MLVLLDLSSAFDTIDHDILVDRMQREFDITGSAKNWFNSYLRDRSNRWNVRKFDTHTDEATSSLTPIGSFVPMPPQVSMANTELMVPANYLSYGLYRFQFTVVQMEKTSERVMSYDSEETWIQITPTDLVPVIAGGSARTQGSSVPIAMDASESYDPDDGEWDARWPMEFTWFCQMSDGEGQVLSGAEILELSQESLQVTITANYCFGDSLQLSYASATWEDKDAMLVEGKAYLFTVVVSKEGRNKVFAQQRVSILPGDPPQMNINCLKNCGQRMVADRRLVLEAECTTNCGAVHSKKKSSLEYFWELMDPMGNVVNAGSTFWSKHTTTGRDSTYVVIKAGAFNNYDQIAGLRVTGIKPGGGTGYAEFAISINAPPRPGSCAVTPSLGYALQTHFKVICESFVDEDLPLTYSVIAVVDEEEEAPSLVYAGADAESPGMHLPLGASKHKNVVQVLVEVKDALGAATSVRTQATVLPPQVDASEDTTDFLLNLTTGEHNELQEYLNVGDYQLVTQIAGTVGSVLNEMSVDETGNEEERKEKERKRIQIRASLVDSLSDAPVESIVSLQQTSSTLALVTKTKSEVTQESQMKAATAFTQMGSFLKSQSSGGDEEQEVIENAATSIVSGLSNIMGAAAITTTVDLGNDNATQNINKSRSVSMSTLSALTDIQDAVVANKIPGESPTTIVTESVIMSVNRQDRDVLVSSPIQAAGKTDSSSFVLPDMGAVQQKIPSDYTGAIDSQMAELVHNPFVWSQPENDVNSPIVSLQLKTTEQQEIQLDNLLSDVDIFVRVSSAIIDSSPPPVASNLTLRGSAIIVFNVSDPNTTLLLTVFPDIEGGAHLLCCLMEAGLNATSACDHNTTVPVGLSSTKGVLFEADLTEADYTWTIPPGTLPTEGSYQLVVSIYNNTDRFAGVTVPLTTRVSSSECVFWDEIEETWSDKGCKVGALSTHRQTHCQCNHLSYFASNFLVKPNKVDFFADAKLFLTFVDNPVVVTTVGAILAAYAVVAIWARRKDKKDALKTDVIILPDSDPFAHYRYVVTVKTGMRRGAGTAATVTLTMTGENGSSLSHVLQNKMNPVLQRGSVDAFLITTRESLGDLLEIRVWHDNEGKSPGWYLSRVMVHDLETDDRWLFLCNKWLAIDMSDGLIDKRFRVATNEQLKKFSNLFGDRTTRGLTDGHLWFSIFSCPARSHFTRLQRVSCCLALLMTTMLTSIMFYGIPDDPTDQAMDFGSFRITVREIIIGIESSLIAFPINLLIVQIFRMAQAHTVTPDHSNILHKTRSKKSSNSSLRDMMPFKARVRNAKQRTTSLTSSTTIEMVGMMEPEDRETKLEEVRLHMAGGNKLEAENKSSSSFSTAEDDSSCNSLGKGLPAQAVSTCDSDWSYFAEASSGSESPSRQHVREVGVRTAVSSDLSSCTTADSQVELLPMASSESRTVGTDSSFAKDSSTSSANIDMTRPMPHNEILIRELQDIATNLENMIPEHSDSETNLRSAQERAQMWILLARSIRTPESSISNVSTKEGTEELDSSVPPVKKRCCSGGLPHWFVYVGWLILILTTGISAYYIMLYGLKYGKQRSIDWLVSLFFSTFQEIFITQPLKVFMFAAFVAMILKKWEEDDDGGEDVEDIDIANAEFEYKHMMKKRRESIWYQPPPLANVHGARIRKIRERKMYELLREICSYVFFMWFVLMLAYSNRDRNAYYLTKHTKDLYFDNKIYHKVFVDLRGFFVWAEDVLIPSLYGEDYDSDMQSDLLGGVRLRQVRVERDSCETLSYFTDIIDSCNAPYSFTTEDKRSYNASSWTTSFPVDPAESHDPWLYHSKIAGRFWGRLNTYGGGGYMANLGATSEEALQILNQLRESRWLDDLTRALFVEWTVYNANTNLFCVVTFTLEMPETGGFFKYPYIQSVRLYRSVASFHLFMFVIEFIFLLYVFYYTYVEISKYRQQRRQYFRCIWNWVEFTSIILCYSIISVYIYRFVVMKRLNTSHSWEKFVSFHQAASVADAFIYLFAFLVIISTVKILHLLRLNPRMYLLTTVISQSATELVAFSILVLAYLCSFTVLANLFFGAHLYNYHSYKMAFVNLFNFLLGSFNHKELLDVNRYAAPIIVITYEAFALYLFMNLFISALSVAMTNVRRKPVYSEDGKLGLLLIDKLLSLLGIDNKKLQKHLNF